MNAPAKARKSSARPSTSRRTHVQSPKWSSKGAPHDRTQRDVVILSIPSRARPRLQHHPRTPANPVRRRDANALHNRSAFRRGAQHRGGRLAPHGDALVDTGSRMDEVIFEEFKARATWR